MVPLNLLTVEKDKNSFMWIIWVKFLFLAVYFEQKEYKKCIEQCEKAVEIGRENRADYKLIAKAFARLGNCHRRMEVSSFILQIQLIKFILFIYHFMAYIGRLKSWFQIGFFIFIFFLLAQYFFIPSDLARLSSSEITLRL